MDRRSSDPTGRCRVTSAPSGLIRVPGLSPGLSGRPDRPSTAVSPLPALHSVCSEWLTFVGPSWPCLASLCPSLPVEEETWARPAHLSSRSVSVTPLIPAESIITTAVSNLSRSRTLSDLATLLDDYHFASSSIPPIGSQQSPCHPWTHFSFPRLSFLSVVTYRSNFPQHP